ncbi:AMP-binding protein [Streptomyces coacervatus]|uniref:AMP-binding protein n=1 Tax=Streptomyces coacervatus TaxID=647381 RepID=A0ABP7JCD2_9ACTN|nr:AMP-binding protein [Streptomyces coacervatus]MDF2264269.1 AMP-binding protein [Streptomyces coacervatus]
MPVKRPGRDAVPNMTDYDAERARFRWEVPQRFNAVLDILERRAEQSPDELALVTLRRDGGVTASYTFRELNLASRRMGHALAGIGVGKGERIFVMLPRIAEWYVALLGAIRIGAVPVPGTPQLTSRDIEYRVDRAEAVAVITDTDGAVKVDKLTDRLPTLAHRVVAGTAPSAGWHTMDGLLARASEGPTPVDPTAADDMMLIYFTSGTVSYPKMVAHTQASFGLGHMVTARYWQDLRPGDLHWTLSDTGWAKAAWSKLFGQWAQGATVLEMDLGKSDPDLILDTIERHGVTTLCAPPTLYRSLVVADLASYDLSRLRHCVSAGEPLNPEVIRIWEEGTRGLVVHDGYGQTETVNVLANFRCLPVRSGSMGKPVPGFDVDVVDDDGASVSVGDEGNVAIRVEPERPAGLFTGYWRDPDATAAAFTNGWYFTGDKARRDEDGYFWFEGRQDDVITSSAYRIGPFEVESALVEHPAVIEAAVVGQDDPDRTQIVTAFVILHPDAAPSPQLAEELQDHVKRLTAPYKYPRRIHFVSDLPKTVSGKIRRGELRDRLRGTTQT